MRDDPVPPRRPLRAERHEDVGDDGSTPRADALRDGRSCRAQGRDAFLVEPTFPGFASASSSASGRARLADGGDPSRGCEVPVEIGSATRARLSRRARPARSARAAVGAQAVAIGAGRARRRRRYAKERRQFGSRSRPPGDPVLLADMAMAVHASRLTVHHPPRRPIAAPSRRWSRRCQVLRERRAMKVATDAVFADLLRYGYTREYPSSASCATPRSRRLRGHEPDPCARSCARARRARAFVETSTPGVL